MTSIQITDASRVWREFLIDLTFAQNYTLGYVLDHAGVVPKNCVVERLLPSLLHIKAVSILDHVLLAWINHHGLVVPKKNYGNDLNGRVNFLADSGHPLDRSSLHRLRGTRNKLAHEPTQSVD